MVAVVRAGRCRDRATRNNFILGVASGIHRPASRHRASERHQRWSFSTLAVTPRNTEEAFLREVDEGVRRDQVATLWQRYGVLAIVTVVLLLGALGGWLWWQDQQKLAAAKAGEDFTQALSKLEVGDTAAAKPVIDRLANDGPDGFRPLATMMQASMAVGAGDEPRAIELLDSVAADAKQPQPLRDAATIKSLRLQFDTLPPATMVAKLKDYSVPGNPWFGVAGEMTALAHIKAGAPDKARPLLIAIVRDATLAGSQRNRAAQLAISLGVEPQSLQPEPAATATPAAPAAAPAP